MKKFILTVAAVVAMSASATERPRLTLHYDRPAEFFEEALVIGNGNLGAVLYGGVKEERISLNDITLWTGEPEKGVFTPDAYKAIPEIRAALDRGDYAAADSLQRKVQGHYSESYQPLGWLTISYEDMPDSTDSYVRALDISDAVAFRGFKKDDKGLGSVYFASAPDSVIVVGLKSEKPVNARVRLGSLLPHEVSSTSDGELRSLGHVAYTSLPSYTPFKEKMKYDSARGTRFCSIVKAIPANGSVVANPDGSLSLKDVSEVMLLITNVTSFNGFDKDPATNGRDYVTLAENRIKRAGEKGFDRLLADHLADYRRLFDRVTLDLGTTPDSVRSLPTDVQLKRYTDLREVNPDLEELYFQYGRYLLISSSRTNGVPANLQGLWNEHLLPPWSSNYTTNINVEENYWPSEVTGLGELHAKSLLPWIVNLSVGGAETARNYYGVNRGWCLGHNSDIWAMTNPVGLNGGDPMWANWNMGGAWLASHIWEHYLFGGDKEFLAEYYPVLKGAAGFCLDWLIDKDGHLLTSPCTSPENQYITDKGYSGASFYGGSADLAMIRQCLSDARDAAKTLGVDADFRSEIDSSLSRLAPYKVSREGGLLEWYHTDWKDRDPQHRHQSHLYGLYPGHHISLSLTPDLARASARTLEIKGDNTTGWSTGWRVNLLARLQDKQGAYNMYRRLLKYVSPDNYKGDDKRTGGGTYPNLLDAHAPFQIDGNFGGTAGVAEMLLQSTPESILVLPSLPAQWADGEVRGLRARGGFVVDMAWQSGKISSLTVSSERGGATKVFLPGEDALDVVLGPNESLELR